MIARHDLRAVRRLLSSLLVALALVIGLGLEPVSADEPIAFSADELLIAEPGTLTRLAVVDISPDQIGTLCTVSLASQNQASVHDGNDLIITTGDVPSVLSDVEAEANAAVDLSVDIVLGPTIEVDLRMGPDWVSSLGFELWLDCGTVEPAADATPTPMAAPAELPTAPPAGTPLPCPESTDGSLSILPADCPSPDEDQPEPEPTAPVQPEPSTPAEPVAPSDEVDAESESVTNTENDTDDEVEVLGIQVQRLPETPAAEAIPAMPTYNG